jgi:hypothetical protein
MAICIYAFVYYHSLVIKILMFMITLNAEMRFKSELKKWDPVTGLVRVILVGCRVFLILISLGIVIWEGYDVTQTYLSKPISTEVKVVPLSSIPNLRLSICMKFVIMNCTFSSPGKICGLQNLPPFKNNLRSSYQDYVQNLSPFKTNLGSSYLYYSNNTDPNKTETTSTVYLSMRNILDQIQYWNNSHAKWETIFDTSTTTIEDEMAMFERQMYPYVDNYTILCHTLNQDIMTLAPLLQLHRKGINNCSTFYWYP